MKKLRLWQIEIDGEHYGFVEAKTWFDARCSGPILVNMYDPRMRVTPCCRLSPRAIVIELPPPPLPKTETRRRTVSPK